MRKNVNSGHKKQDASERIWPLLLTYFLVVSLYFLCRFIPEERVWGINWWAYHPVWFIALLTCVAFLVPILVFRWFVKSSKDNASAATATIVPHPLAWGVGLAVLLTAGFIFLPNATHFLGDGYRLIERLAVNAQFIKAWDFGASAINWLTYTLLGAGGSVIAERAFYVNAIVGGVIVLLATAWFAWRFPAANDRRLLLFSGIVTSGYMLQYFGYTENYAFLIAGILIYTMMGVAASQGRLSFWWLLIPLAFSVFIHLWAVALLPSFVYLAIRKTEIGRKFVRMPIGTKRVVTISILVVLIALHQFLCHYNYFFTFAFLPLFPDRFTVDNAWLFSPTHTLDMANLFLLLVSGVVLVPVVVAQMGGVKLLRDDPYPFLILVFVFALGVTFVFNPRLGMPRDWDLYSFMGPPLAVLCFVLFIDLRLRKAGLVAAVLAITLNVLSLVPRAAAEANAEIGIQHFRNYLNLDPKKCATGTYLLTNYYKTIGDTTAAAEEQKRINSEYPESADVNQAYQLMNEKKFGDAIAMFRRVLTVNPANFTVWGNIGTCYAQIGNLDSALECLRIADGLDPYCADFLTNLGHIYMLKQDFVQAETSFRKALRCENPSGNAVKGLAVVYITLDKFADAAELLRKTAVQNNVPPASYLLIARQLIEKNAYAEAKIVLEIAQQKGLDSQILYDMAKKYPALQIAE